MMACTLSIMAQSMSIHKGDEQTFFNLSEVDSITFDPTPNLWQNAEKSIRFYYAPSWNQIADPTYTEQNGTYTLTLTRATSAQWQAQMHFITNLATDAHKNYNFRIKIRSDKALTATVKLYQDGNDNLYFFEERLPIGANEECSFERKDMPGLDMNRVCLVLDFGSNRANTEVKISSISFTEKDYDSSLDLNSCPLPDYRLVWNDEFSSRTISSTRWTYQTADAGWVNHELQTYVNGKSPKGTKVAESSDGTLKIHTFKEGEKIYSARLYGRKSVGLERDLASLVDDACKWWRLARLWRNRHHGRSGRRCQRCIQQHSLCRIQSSGQHSEDASPLLCWSGRRFPRLCP